MSAPTSVFVAARSLFLTSRSRNTAALAASAGVPSTQEKRQCGLMQYGLTLSWLEVERRCPLRNVAGTRYPGCSSSTQRNRARLCDPSVEVEAASAGSAGLRVAFTVDPSIHGEAAVGEVA